MSSRYAARALALLAGPILLAGCAGDPDPAPAPDATVELAELEQEVARRYVPQRSGLGVVVSCEGDLEGRTGATQRCRVQAGRDRTDLLAEVTSVDEGRVVLDTAPLVAPAEVAETLRTSLVRDGYDVDTVVCAGELVGRQGEMMACTAEPSAGEGTVEVRVTRVTGLDVKFRYRVGAA